MEYKLVLGYRASYRKWSVKILFPVDEDCVGCDREEGDFQDIAAMTAWCERTGLGRRMAYDEFMFDNETDATVFILKFS